MQHINVSVVYSISTIIHTFTRYVYSDFRDLQKQYNIPATTNATYLYLIDHCVLAPVVAIVLEVPSNHFWIATGTSGTSADPSNAIDMNMTSFWSSEDQDLGKTLNH